MHILSLHGKANRCESDNDVVIQVLKSGLFNLSWICILEITSTRNTSNNFRYISYIPMLNMNWHHCLEATGVWAKFPTLGDCCDFSAKNSHSAFGSHFTHFCMELFERIQL